MHRTFSLDYALSVTPLTASDIAFGERYRFVDRIKPARLSHLFPEEAMPTQWSTHHEKWRLISLAWAVENCSSSNRSLLDEIDSIWSCFNEPEDMKHLVSFLPSDDPGASEETLKQKIVQFVHAKREDLSEDDHE